jgi:hypothetical protein
LCHRCPVEFRDGDWRLFVVMAGPVQAIHVFTRRAKDVEGRHKGGHDDEEWLTSNAASIPWTFHRTAVALCRPSVAAPLTPTGFWTVASRAPMGGIRMNVRGATDGRHKAGHDE